MQNTPFLGSEPAGDTEEIARGESEDKYSVNGSEAHFVGYLNPLPSIMTFGCL